MRKILAQASLIQYSSNTALSTWSASYLKIFTRLHVTYRALLFSWEAIDERTGWQWLLKSHGSPIRDGMISHPRSREYGRWIHQLVWYLDERGNKLLCCQKLNFCRFILPLEEEGALNNRFATVTCRYVDLREKRFKQVTSQFIHHLWTLLKSNQRLLYKQVVFAPDWLTETDRLVELSINLWPVYCILGSFVAAAFFHLGCGKWLFLFGCKKRLFFLKFFDCVIIILLLLLLVIIVIVTRVAVANKGGIGIV